MGKIPFPTIQRMSYMYDALDKLEQASIHKVSSSELGAYVGQTACTVRKDIHLLAYNGVTGVKYNVSELKKLIRKRLGFEQKRNACIIGLGEIGRALLEYLGTAPQHAYRIVAGFDSNVNRLETIQTGVELFPGYKIEEVVKQKGIELALITVPFSQAQEVADKCCDGGISGILNFSPLSLTVKRKGVFVRSYDIGCELNVLSALTFLK
jgi:redox-sensing transcriptional repressor